MFPRVTLRWQELVFTQHLRTGATKRSGKLICPLCLFMFVHRVCVTRA